MHRTATNRTVSRAISIAAFAAATAGCAGAGDAYSIDTAIERVAELRDFEMRVTLVAGGSEIETRCLVDDVRYVDCTVASSPASEIAEFAGSQVRFDLRSDVVYLRGGYIDDIVELYGAITDVDTTDIEWVSFPKDAVGMVDIVAVDTSTIEEVAGGAFLGKEPAGAVTTMREDESVRIYTFAFSGTDVTDQLSTVLDAAELVETVDVDAGIEMTVTVSESSELRSFSLTATERGGTKLTYTVELAPPAEDASIAMPDPATVLDSETLDSVSGGVIGELRTACADGDMAACDDLYWESPPGSDDEAFGASCGGTDDATEPGTCATSEIADDSGDLVAILAATIARDVNAMGMFSDDGFPTIEQLESAVADAALRYGSEENITFSSSDLVAASGCVSITDEEGTVWNVQVVAGRAAVAAAGTCPL